jgi:putative membrane protein
MLGKIKEEAAMFLTKSITTLNDVLSFIVYFITAIVLLAIFAKVYEKMTPFREFDLIRRGDVAAACSFGGALLGFAIPLASAIAHSLGLIDMILWGAIALIVQLLTFQVIKLIFPTIVADIPNNELSKGIFLGIVSLIAGILNAACIT